MIVEIKNPKRDYVHCNFCTERTQPEDEKIIEFGAERQTRVVVGICIKCLTELVLKVRSHGFKI
jgi:hypothetical protein